MNGRADGRAGGGVRGDYTYPELRCLVVVMSHRGRESSPTVLPRAPYAESMY